MFRFRVTLALAALVALICVQAALVYWGTKRVHGYAQHSRLASDILSELLELSANKQRLRVWASQQLMNANASDEVRTRLLSDMAYPTTGSQDRYCVRRTGGAALLPCHGGTG